jgi:hypothetical protein
MNRPVHFEIHATDPASLSKFYADAFGWKVTHVAQFNYWIFDTGGGAGINGGMLKRMGPKPAAGAAVNAFVTSLGVTSLDDVLAKALAAGATVALPKMVIPGVGYQVYIRDPDDNLLGLHQADTNAK